MEIRSIEQKQKAVDKFQPDYMDDDIVLIDNFHDLSKYHYEDDTMTLDAILLLVCKRGKLQMRIKSKLVVVHPNDVLCCSPNTIMSDLMTSPDFEANILCLSPRIIQSVFHSDNNIWNHYFYLWQHPIINIEEDFLRLYEYYYQLITYRMKFPKNKYNKEVMLSIISALLYDFLSYLGKSPLKTINNETEYTQGNGLFKKFIELLSSHTPKERSVTYYAERLCVTPKHLSTTIKNISGKTAFDWIHEYVLEDVKQQLANPNLSIKEITDYLGFPNMSFFGKYVKTRLGMSPTEYRKLINNRK